MGVATVEHADTDLVEGLQGLAVGLEADGYTMDARWTADEGVEVTIGATPDACEDCLVPKDLMRSIAATMLAGSGIAVDEDKVVVVYPEGSAAH